MWNLVGYDVGASPDFLSHLCDVEWYYKGAIDGIAFLSHLCDVESNTTEGPKTQLFLSHLCDVELVTI